MSSPTVRRQSYPAGGRINQKRRTRAVVLAAAIDLLREGRVPTVAEAAECGSVSRATAYRYFPTQELLLVEAGLHAITPDLEQVLAPPVSVTDPEARMEAVTSALQMTVVRNEAVFRTLLRLSLEAKQEDPQNEIPERWSLRGGRRVVWAEAALAPVRAQLGELRFRRLVSALALLLGIETLVVLRDVCGLAIDDAEEVTHWAVQALVKQSLQETDGPT